MDTVRWCKHCKLTDDKATPTQSKLGICNTLVSTFFQISRANIGALCQERAGLIPRPNNIENQAINDICNYPRL